MELELSIAQQMIEHIIPRQMPQLHEYDLAAWSRPVVQTGGDIYDLAPISCDSTEHLLLLADATGHGIGPAVSIAQFRAMVRLALRFDVSMTHMVEHINARLSEDLLDGRFITAFLGRLDPTSHTIEYHAMGHGPLLLYESEHRAFRLLASTSFPLGVLPVDQNARSSSLILQPGDCLVVLSDGFHEAGQSDGEQFGIERIQSLLKESANTPAHAMIQTLVDAVDQFTDGNQVDDMTALVVKRHPSSHHHHAKGV
jgi:phosphoserine phosphatase